MKKLIILVSLFLCAVLAPGAAETGSEIPGKGPSRVKKNRRIELGSSMDFGFANDFLSAGDIFQETAVIDLDKLKDGLQMDMALNLSPLFFNYNRDDKWGFGAFISTEAVGNMSLSGNMLTFRKAEDDRSGIGAAVFAEVGGRGFFYLKKFKIKINSAVFYPLFYIQPDISYTHKTGTKDDGNDTIELVVTYDMDVYSAFSMEDMKNIEGLTGHAGFDFGGGLEYPLFSFLDLGADLTHIPLVPAVLTDYMRLEGTVGIKETDDIINADMGDIFSTDGSEAIYGTGEKIILRPFKLLAWADYRPFNFGPLSFIPSAGFAVNPLYTQPVSAEGGLRVRYNLANIFIPTIGISYEDRLWKNSLDMVFDFRAVEIDFGIALQSQSFVKSWTAGGLALSLGIKAGW
jgi:hypothetical protein